MDLVDLHLPTSCQSLLLNADVRSLVATEAKCTAASDLHHCATAAGYFVTSSPETSGKELSAVVCVCNVVNMFVIFSVTLFNR